MHAFVTTLPAREERAIAALLCSPSLVEAAKLARVGLRTLRRLLRREDFAAAYQEARREAVRLATARLQHVAAGAVDALHAVMVDAAAPPAARVSAARAVLELAYRATEIEDLEARVAELERGQVDDGGSHGAAQAH